MTDFDPDKLKHKPNEKHTLEEVLKSLQDLIHNDLLHGSARRAEAPARPSEADATPTTGVGGASSEPGATPPATDVPFESVVESLEALVTKDLADDSMEGGGRAASGDGRDAGGSATPGAVAGTAADDSMEGGGRAASGDGRDAGGSATPGAVAGTAAGDDSTSARTPEPTAPETTARAPRQPSDSVQQTFGFDDEVTPDDAGAPTVDSASVEVDRSVPSGETEPIPDPAIPVLTESIPAERFADDLPVLEDVAATGARSAAQEIAERVIARLIAERQARGQPVLDAELLATLRRLLREELERRPPD